jgi:hypothetical protein
MARGAALILLATHAAARSVEVSIRAPWPTRAVSPLLEAAEFLAGEGRSVYWSFVEAIGDGFGDASTKEKIRAASSASTYDGEGYEEMASIVLDAAEKRLDGLAHALLRMALAVRTYAPRLEAHRSLASQAPTCNGDVESTRAIIYGPSGRHVACKASDVSALVAKAAEQVCTSPQCSDAAPRLGSETPFSEDSSDVTIELIIDVTSSQFKEWHSACSATEATYFLRHASHLRGSSNQTQLQAFGANLDIKDLEYKNMDDSTTETTTTKASTTFEAVWKSTSELGYPETYCGETFVNLHAVEPTRSREQRRVDGVGRPKFDSTQVRGGRGSRWDLSRDASSKAARPEAGAF